MPKPQQPELHRSRLGRTDQDGKDLRARDTLPPPDESIGPVPPENRPGHDHPEPDKPSGPPQDR